MAKGGKVGKDFLGNWCAHCGKYVSSLMSYQLSNLKPWCADCDQLMNVRVKNFLAREARRVREQVKRFESSYEEKPIDLMLEEWMGCIDYWEGKCVGCSATFSVMDHWLNAGFGFNGNRNNNGTTADNVVPLCASCNHKKCSLPPIKYLLKILPESSANERLQAVNVYFDWIKQPRLLRMSDLSHRGTYTERIITLAYRARLVTNYYRD